MTSKVKVRGQSFALLFCLGIEAEPLLLQWFAARSAVLLQYSSAHHRRNVPSGLCGAVESRTPVWVVRGSREQNSEALTLAAPGRPMMEDSDIEIRPVFEMEDFGESMTEELREQEDRLRARIEEK